MTEHKWMDKAIGLHRKHGIRELDLSQLRQLNKTDALDAAGFLYEDMVENSHLYPGYEDVIRDLKHFSVDDKPKAVGVIFEVIETCGRECNLPALRNISQNWNLGEDKLFAMLQSFK